MLTVTTPPPAAGVAASVTQFAYNSLGELTQITDPLNNLTKLTYTSAGLIATITDAQGTNSTESYSYDAVGNRLSSLNLSPYSYNTSNELTSTPSASYTFDYNGNTLSRTDSTGTTNYTWDFQNRLTSVALPGSGGTISFAYDPFGRRIKKITPSTTSIFAYDGDGNLVEETNTAGTAVARYVQTTDSVDEPLAMLRGGSASYYHADGLGSVTSLSTSSGSIAQSYTFDSFGNLTAASGSLANPFQYSAREFDSETNLYYYRARYYRPTTGQFISEDPAGFSSDSFNFYDYVSNNPLVFSDPSGLWKFHGNWCGPNWTGGKVEPYIPKHDDIPGYYAPGIDYVDIPCSNHDRCYANRRQESLEKPDLY